MKEVVLFQYGCSQLLFREENAHQNFNEKESSRSTNLLHCNFELTFGFIITFSHIATLSQESTFVLFSASKHEPDGRVIIAEFESFLLLNTYAPNNGWKEEENSFQRRRKWDKRMLEFVQQVDKPLIWCGDLNVR